MVEENDEELVCSLEELEEKDGNNEEDGCCNSNNEDEIEEKLDSPNVWNLLRQSRNYIVILVPFMGALMFFLSTLVDVILFNAIPTTEGEYRFRDMRESSIDDTWVLFNNTQGEIWKKHIHTHPTAATTGNATTPHLGKYELIAATVFVQSRGHSKRTPPLGPVDSRFVSLTLRWEEGNMSDIIYLTLEKVSEAPEVVKMVVGGDDMHSGGI